MWKKTKKNVVKFKLRGSTMNYCKRIALNLFLLITDGNEVIPKIIFYSKKKELTHPYISLIHQ